MNDDHPLVLYIHSLSTALSTHHTQLPHHARTQSQLNLLSREISILNQELAALRAQSASLPTSTDSLIKINQLSLALRALNEKLEFTERVLLERTKQWNHVSADVSAAKSAMDAAYDLVESLYAKEQELFALQTELQTKLRLEEEKNKSNELVIQEYADLVRKLEGRRSSITSSRKDHHHQRNLSEEFKSQTTKLQHQLSTSHHDLSLLQTQLDAQTKVNETLLSRLSELQLELDKQKRDDNTASKMVSRYMKFSQQTTNTLQTTLTSLQSRHTSTLTSYTSQIHLLQTHLQNSLPPSFDHIHTQLLKESFGRRQETRFRLHLLRREEKLVEELKRWLRRNEERLSVIQDDDREQGGVKIYFMEMIQDAKIIIDTIDNPIQINSQHPPISGSLARFVTVQSTVHDLLERLHYEQERRMELEELVGCGVSEREEDGKGEGDMVKEPTESGRIYPSSSSSTNGILEGSTAHISEGLPDDTIVEPKVDLHQDMEPSVNEPTESITERTYPLSSSYTNNTNDVSEESTAHIPDDSITQPKVDVHQEVESSVKGTTESGVERTYPLSPSSSNNISEKSPAHIPERLPDDIIAQPKVDVSQEVESSVKESVTEHIYPLSSSYTNDLAEESTAHVQVPIPEIVEPKEIKEDTVIERGDTAKDEVKVVVNEEIEDTEDTVINTAEDEGKVVVNEEVKDTDAGSIDQSEKETGGTQLEVDPSSLPSPSPSNPPPPSSENIKPPHPLLKPLHQTRIRYTHIQNSFHDCHIALENLKSHLTSSSSSTPQTINKKPNIPYESIRTIVQRLDDYTEDVRVELEIRILDEEVLGRGYETLLMMCGGGGGGGDGDGEWNEEEVLAFVNGTDPVIVKALKGFERKLKDLEEDVAVVKKVVYSLDDDGDDDDEDKDDDDNHKLKKKIISTPESLSTDTLVASPTPGWISSWISPSRSTTPIPQLQPPSHLPNLTFGKIMTNRPRLISTSSSSSNLNSSSILRRTVSSLGLSSPHNHLELSMKSYHGGIHSRMTTGDVIKALQLKTSMPELLVNRNELDVTEEDEDNNIIINANGVPFKPGLISTFSSLGSSTPITATLKSSSFALGMGMRGRGGGGGNRGLRGGRGMLGSVGLDDERRRRRVVSAAAAAPASSTVLKKVVDGGDKEKDVSKEDVD